MTLKEEYALVSLVVGLANNPHISGPWAKKDLITLLKWMKANKERLL